MVARSRRRPGPALFGRRGDSGRFVRPRSQWFGTGRIPGGQQGARPLRALRGRRGSLCEDAQSRPDRAYGVRGAGIQLARPGHKVTRRIWRYAPGVAVFGHGQQWLLLPLGARSSRRRLGRAARCQHRWGAHTVRRIAALLRAPDYARGVLWGADGRSRQRRRGAGSAAPRRRQRPARLSAALPERRTASITHARAARLHRLVYLPAASRRRRCVLRRRPRTRSTGGGSRTWGSGYASR